MIQFKRMLRRVSRLLFPRLFLARDVTLVAGSAVSGASLREQISWLESVVDWVRSPVKIPPDIEPIPNSIHGTRLKFLFRCIESNPEWKCNTGDALREILSQTSAVDLFSRTGLAQEKGLFSEIADRILRKALPAPRRDRDLDDILPRLFHSEKDALWVETLPGECLQALAVLLGGEPTTSPFSVIRNCVLDSLTILSEEVAARGIGHDMRTRLPACSPNDSPFFKLRQKTDVIVSILRDQHGARFPDYDKDIDQCFEAIDQIYQHLDKRGVSVNLVYNLESQKLCLQRMRRLLQLLAPGDQNSHSVLIAGFVAQLIRETHQALKLRSLIRSNLRLLSQKVVERAGASGEHYITRSKEEYRRMFRAGLGGGAVTVLTTLNKIGISSAHLPLFFDGFFASTNYAASFVVLQLLGFTLATKQPAMTGPALAGKLKHLESHESVIEFVDEVARLTRSQFAAVFGNLGAAAPIAFLADMAKFWLTGSHLITIPKATLIVSSLDPFKSLTIVFAAWTGVTLWSSGIVAGWVENWAVYRMLPEAIKEHPHLVRIFGPARAGRLGDWFLHNVGSLSSSVALGFMLGFTPIIGAFFGFPLDVRHVTLSTAALALAAGNQIGPEFNYSAFGLATLGILATLTLNFTVSFALAFFVAARARDVSRRTVLLLMKFTLNRLVRRPLAFFILR